MTEVQTIAAPAGGWRAPWPQVFEVSSALPADRWSLVGGLMVQALALASGVETNRVTLDVDAAVRVEAGTFRYTEAASALKRLGYTVDESTQLTYRFRRDADIVDLMVADHQRPAPRHARREVMTVAGGRQALERQQQLRFQVGSGLVTVPVPNLHGALVLKAAAHMVDPRDRDRHLLDAITLLACISDVEPILEELRGSDRKRLGHVLRAIDEQRLISAQVPNDTLLLAQQTMADLKSALS